MKPTDQLIGTSEAARRLGVSEKTVTKLDAVLQPLRTETGRRVFRADTVDRVAAERAKERR